MKYDPETCLTAGELREVGVIVEESIPDNAWVPRACIEFEGVKVQKLEGDQNAMNATINVQLTEPFRWIEISGSMKL